MEPATMVSLFAVPAVLITAALFLLGRHRA
jgi:hypothetical protein